MFIAHQTKFVLFIILEFGTRTIFLFIVHALKFILLIILVNIYDVQFRFYIKGIISISIPRIFFNA
jgi:hypothetical protein